MRAGSGPWEPPPERRPRGRPRSEQAEQAILRATLDLLAEGTTISGLSMEAVAARACVGKATIYRRWPHKEPLIVDALAELKEPVPEAPAGSVRDELVFYVDRIRSRTSTAEGRIFPVVLAELRHHPRLFAQYDARVTEPRREMVRAALRRGIASGELRPDLDIEVALLMLVGPMLFLTMMHSGDSVPPALSEQMVDAALDGMRVR